MPLLGLTFMLLLAVAISIAVQVIGVLLIFALMVTPAAGAVRLTKRPLTAVVLSVLVALSAAWVGLFRVLVRALPGELLHRGHRVRGYRDRPSRSGRLRPIPSSGPRRSPRPNAGEPGVDVAVPPGAIEPPDPITRHVGSSGPFAPSAFVGGEPDQPTSPAVRDGSEGFRGRADVDASVGRASDDRRPEE